jgi:putative transcriptional regulator
MNTKNFNSLMKGAREALAFAQGDKSIGKATVIEVDDLDVAKIRAKVKLSQDAFASAFGIKPATLRNWEQNRVKPQGPARVLLTLIDRAPAAVIKALHVAPGGRRKAA